MIKILNDFFNDEDFKRVQDFSLNKAFYTPSYFDNAPERTKEYYYGSRFHLIRNKELLNLFKEQCELKFKIKINKINENSGIDLRNLDHFKPHTDKDSAKINILIMISGPTAVTNGTVFYTDKKLDIHVGFKENRAIIFDSDISHCSLQFDSNSAKRYVMANFINNPRKEDKK